VKASFFLALALSLFLAGFCFSAEQSILQFPDGFELEIKGDALESNAHSIFRFTVNSPGKVDLSVVKKSCGCIDATLDKSIYLSGEKGTVGTTVTFGEIDGLRAETITLRAVALGEENKQELYTLVVRSNIPSVASVTPQVLKWKKAEFDSRDIRIETVSDKLTIADVKLTGGSFVIVDKQLAAGGTLEVVTVKPTAESTTSIGSLEFSVKSKERVIRLKHVLLLRDQ
jgi:hypothetical protein